jgi:tetratricopeptide (TPR) repeat protein
MKSIKNRALNNAFFEALSEFKNFKYTLTGKLILFLIFLFGIYFSATINIYYGIPMLLVILGYLNSLLNKIYRNYIKNLNDESFLQNGTHTIVDLFYNQKKIVNLKNGIRNGTYIQYFKNNGSIEFKRNYINGILNGQNEEFYENGQLKVVSKFNNGIEEGKKFYYNNDGTLIIESEIINGINKEFIEYDKCGNIKIVKNNNKFSFYTWDDFQSKNIKICDINIDNDGLFSGICLCYNSNGEIDYSFDFENAIQIGKIVDFNNGHHGKFVYEVNKIVYDSSVKKDLCKPVYLIGLNSDIQTEAKYSYNRFNNKPYARSTGMQGPPGIGTIWIEIKPVLSISDLIKIIDETYFLGNDMKNDGNIRLVSKNTLNPLELYERGKAKDENSDYDGAIIDFTKAIELDSEYIDAFRGRASARIWINDYKGVVDDYTKVIELNFDDIDAYRSRGHAKASIKDYKGALKDFNKTIELDNESKAYSSRGRIKKKILDYDGALVDYNIAVEKFPEDYSGYFGRGELKYEIEDYFGAIEDFNKCIELKPARIIVYHKRGDCKLKIEDYNGAIEDYSIVIDNRQDKYGIDGPPSQNAANILALTYHKRGIARNNIKEYNEAINDFNYAINLNPSCEDGIKIDIEIATKQC